MDEKKNMRADVLGRRDALDAETRARKSAAICRELERLVEEACAPDAGACGACSPDGNSAEADRLGPAHGVRAYRNLGRPPCVAVYAAMRSEVDLQAFAESAFARGWDVCFPCMVRDEADGQGPGRMAFYRVPGARLDHARAAFLDHPLRCLPCAALADAGYEEAAPAEMCIRDSDDTYDESMFDAMQQEYESQLGLTWVGMYGFNNTYGLAVSKDVAERYDLRTYSDLAGVASELTLGAEPDFYDRQAVSYTHLDVYKRQLPG